MITPLGLALLAAMGFVLVFARHHFVWFLSAMVPLSQTAMFVVAGQGVSPFYVAAIVATVMGVNRVLAVILRDRGHMVPFPTIETALLAAFTGYALLVTALGPIAFEGLGVLSPRKGLGDQLTSLTPLEHTVSNLAQASYLALGVGVVVYVLSLRSISPRVLEAGIWLGLGITLVNAAYLKAGAQFPRELFDTIPTISYQVGDRLRGPFAEPSVLGAFLTGSVAYLIHRTSVTTGRSRHIATLGLVVALAEYGMSASGTALIGMAVLTILAAATVLAPWARAGMRGIEKVSMIGLALLAAAIWQSERLSGATIGVVAEKLTSNSYSERTAADSIAMSIVSDTWGVGVGLGSNRPSSLGAMLLSCVGVVGTLLLGALILIAVRNARRSVVFAGSGWALLGVAVAMSVAKADLATPLLWMALAVSMRSSMPVRAAELPTRTRLARRS